MSDRDLLFGGEDPFGDDDPFGGDDDWGGEGGETFDDLGDDDFQADLGDEGEDLPAFGDEVEEEQQGATLFGLNRRFVTIGALIALILCVGIIGLIFVIQQNAGPSDVDLTVTSVLATNTFVAYALELTETQNAVSRDLTATADSWTATPSPTPTPTETPSPSPTVELATQVPIFMTPTGGAGGGLNASQIELTATALAAILSGSGGALPTPTSEMVGDGGGFVTVTPSGPVATALPDTGLFDAGFAGGRGMNGLLTAGLAALGLAAVIVVSRRLRSR
ncbi:MAG: hypothetical protein JXN59_19330 [Anaerolineae bacterium]|nr:hypothetical protein [Anaerolineae bacterium]